MIGAYCDLAPHPQQIENVLKAELVVEFEAAWAELRQKRSEDLARPSMAYHGTAEVPSAHITHRPHTRTRTDRTRTTAAYVTADTTSKTSRVFWTRACWCRARARARTSATPPTPGFGAAASTSRLTPACPWAIAEVRSQPHARTVCAHTHVRRWPDAFAQHTPHAHAHEQEGRSC
jgi:hypothetical protein